jgi:hypothetical protein
MSQGNTPTELMQRSKEKFVLGQARLRREQIELTLLSLYGSLDDGLRAYLLLHGTAVAPDNWLDLIPLLREDARHPLTRDEAHQLQRIHNLHSQISRGEAITLAAESADAYQQFAAALLLRYGVTVVAHEIGGHTAALTEAEHWWRPATRPGFLRRHRRPLRRTLAALLALGAVVGIALVLLLNPPAALEPWLQPGDTSTRQTAATPGPTASALLPGRTAFVRADLGRDMALYDEPGASDAESIQLYLRPDTAVQIIDGPVEINGTTWWQVRALNMSGWCRETWLEPR